MFKRLLNAIAAFFNMFVGGVEQISPEAMLDLEKENLRKYQASFNASLAQQAGQSELLMNLINDEEKRIPQLTSQVKVYLGKGDRKTAAIYAAQLEKLQVTLDEQHKLLAGQEANYKRLTAARDQAVNEALAKIESIKNALTDAKMKEAAANLVEMGNAMISDIGGSGDTLNRLEEKVNERRAKAAGRARVATDARASIDPAASEEVQASLADDALSRFEAKQSGTQPAALNAPSLPDPVLTSAKDGATVG